MSASEYVNEMIESITTISSNTLDICNKISTDIEEYVERCSQQSYSEVEGELSKYFL